MLQRIERITVLDCVTQKRLIASQLSRGHTHTLQQCAALLELIPDRLRPLRPFNMLALTPEAILWWRMVPVPL